MIKLRQLEPKDAPLMLEWMHDTDIQKSFKRNMLGATIKSAVEFCEKATVPKAPSDGHSVHFAIADDEDEYLGTVSLKNIDINDKTAEYAIATRKCAQGKGIGFLATGMVLKIAFEEYGLNKVYLNVLEDNIPAVRMYERSGFVYEGLFRNHVVIDGTFRNLKWYGMLKSEFNYNTFLDDGGTDKWKR